MKHIAFGDVKFSLLYSKILFFESCFLVSKSLGKPMPGLFVFLLSSEPEQVHAVIAHQIEGRAGAVGKTTE